MLHLRSRVGLFIIKAVKMKQTVRNVEPKLMLERCPEAPCLSLCRLGADKNLAVLKGDHVGWAREIKEAAM